jgi:Transcriptional regulators
MENTFSVERAEDSSGFLLWQVTSLWQQKIKKVLNDKYQLNHSQFVIMTSIHWLTLHNDEVTQVSLAQHTKMESMNVSQILKSLQSKNYIIRKEHPTDTRAKIVFLSSTGEQLIRQAIVDVDIVDKNFFKKLGKIETFNHSLLKLIQTNL